MDKPIPTPKTDEETKKRVEDARAARGEAGIKLSIMALSAGAGAGAAAGASGAGAAAGAEGATAAAGAEGATAATQGAGSNFVKGLAQDPQKAFGIFKDIRTFAGKKTKRSELRAEGYNRKQIRQIRSAEGGGWLKGVLTLDIARGVHNLRAYKAFFKREGNNLTEQIQTISRQLPSQTTPARREIPRTQLTRGTEVVDGQEVQTISGIGKKGPFSIARIGQGIGSPTATMTGPEQTQGAGLMTALRSLVQNPAAHQPGITTAIEPGTLPPPALN